MTRVVPPLSDTWFAMPRSSSRTATFPRLGTVCRAGLATRGNTHLAADDVLEAVRRGVNYLNWCGYPDGLSQAMRRLGPRRRQLFLAVQLNARSATAARRELTDLLRECGTDYFDVVTYYYVEHPEEWDEIVAPGGAAEALEAARRAGIVKAIGLTSHQRPLAAQLAQTGRLDMLMIRYNAAHRGAEREIFPTCRQRNLPVVTYTGLRWGALLQPTPDDPVGFVPPPAPDWYRFVLAHSDVTVGLMAPNDRAELEADLALLDDWRPLPDERYDQLAAHGARVHRYAGLFP